MVDLTDAELCHSFTRWLVERKTPQRGIEILKKAIRKIQLFDSQLTSVHADLCQLSLLSKCLKPALELLDTDITSINQEVCICICYTYIIKLKKDNIFCPNRAITGGNIFTLKHFLLKCLFVVFSEYINYCKDTGFKTSTVYYCNKFSFS